MASEPDERQALEHALRRLEWLRSQATDSRLCTQHLDECITALRARIDGEREERGKVVPLRRRRS